MVSTDTDAYLRVLVLEDNDEALLLLRYYLTSRAIATFASTVADAIEADAVEGPFDLYVLDINLGEDRDGVDVLRLLHERHGRDRVRALALTAYALPGDKKKFLDAGFSHYLAKPFARKSLVEILDEATALPRNEDAPGQQVN